MNFSLKLLLAGILRTAFNREILLCRLQSEGISITFDDGPHPENTPKIINILRQREIKAIFFVQGSYLKKYPALGRLIIDNGHELGNHTFDHQALKHVSFKEFQESVFKAQELLSTYESNNNIKLLRTPHGQYNIQLLVFAIKHSYILVDWTHDSRDSFIRNPQKLIEYVTHLPIQKGDILLFHEDYAHTVEALPAILDNLLKQGHRFQTLKEMLS